MASDNQREFLVLYTHQKTKKSKRWQDGILKVSHQTSRAVLFDDRGCKLDAVYVKPKQVAVGEELESERYLITIEEEKQSGCASKEKDGSEGAQRSQHQQQQHLQQHQQQQHQQQQHQQQQLPKTDFQNRMRVPLKRKRTGFTVPRQVVKKLATANDDVHSGLPSSISHQKKTGMETAPHFGRRAPLFSTPFSKEMESLSDSMDCAGTVLGSQETKQVSDRPSMSLNDQSQSYMYQTKENHTSSCTLPSTLEDSSPPPCYNVDTPKGDRLGHAVLGAPSLCNGLRTFAGSPNAIPDKENVLNLIPNQNIDEKIAVLKEGIVIKEQLYRQDHFEGQDCVFLSSRETSLPPVQESDLTHNTTAISKPSLPSVGKRSTSQILALLGKGNGKFKPPIKQLDSDRTLKVSETAPHACSADLKTLFHSPVTESPSVMPSEQVLSEDIDVMELLGRANLSTADSCIQPLPDQFDLDSVNSSRISHEVLGRCSHETVQGNELHTALSDNLPKPSTLGETKESVVHVGSMEKLCEVEQDNGSSLQTILGKKNQGKNEDVQNFHEKPKIRNQQDKSQEEINHLETVVVIGHRNQGSRNQTRNQIDGMIVHLNKKNQDCGNQDVGNQTSNQIDGINVDKANQDCGNQGDGNQTDGINVDKENQDCGNQDAGNQIENQVDIMNDDGNQNQEKQGQNNVNRDKNQTYRDKIRKHVKDANSCSDEISQGCSKNQSDSSQDGSSHDSVVHHGDCNQGDSSQDSKNHGENNHLDDGNRGDEITQECRNQGDGNRGDTCSNSQDDGNHGNEITQECHNQGDGNRGDSNSLDDGNHGDEITQECHNQGDGNRGDSNSQDDGNHGNSNQESNKQNTSHAVGDNRDIQDDCDVTHGTSSNRVNAGTHCSNCYNDSFQEGRILPENHPSELIIHKLRTDSETATHTAVAEITYSKVACALCGFELSNTLQDMCSECNDELTTGFESSWKSGNHSQERQLRVSSQDATTEVSVMQNKLPDTGEAVLLSSSSSECCILVKHNGVSLPSKFENARASPKLKRSNQAPAEVIDGEYTVQKHVLSIENQDKQSFRTDPTNIISSNGTCTGESSQHDDFALESASLLSTMLSTGHVSNQCGLRNFKSSALQREVNKDLKIIQDPSQIPINTFEFPHHSEDKSIRMVDRDRTTLFQYPVEDWLRNVDSMSSAELGETRDCVVPQMTVTLPRTGCWDQDKQELVPKMDLLVMNRRENEVAPNYQLHVHHGSKVSHQLETVTKDHQPWAESSSSSTEQCVPVDQDRSAAGDLTVSQDEYVQHESPGRRDMHLVRGFFHSNVLKRMSEDTSGETLPVPEVQTRSHPFDVIPSFRSPNSKWSQDISFFDPVKLRGVARRGRTEIVSHEMEADDFNQGLTAKQIHPRKNTRHSYVCKVSRCTLQNIWTISETFRKQ